MKNKIDVTIIIPFLNEAQNMTTLATELEAFCFLHKDLKIELLLVDDGSTDDSIFTIKAQSFPAGTRIIALSRNFGSHAALRAGMVHAKGDYVCFLYADLQDPIENVARLHEIAASGMDIVWGVRKSVEGGRLEIFFSQLYANLMKRFVNPGFPDRGFDIVMMSRKVVEYMNSNVESHSSVFLQLLNLGFRQAEFQYDKKQRIAGKSKWTISKKVKLLLDSFIAFSYAPIRFVTYAGVIFFLIGIGWTFYISVRKLFFDDLASGWPMLTSILFLGFGLTNISLGVIAEYLWRTLDVARKRPVFVIDQVIDLDVDGTDNNLIK